MAAPYRTVIDCDPGRDDGLAILAALGSPALDVEFVTTVAGNVPVEVATANALGVLALAGARRVPAYQGAAAPLRRSYNPAPATDGDLPASDPPLPGSRGRLAGHAYTALREWCSTPSERPKRLIATGPLTNIGRLLRDDGRALSGLDAVFVMGGTVTQMATRASPTAEFNFHTDPEAADLLMRSGAPIRLFDYDATSDCQISVDAIAEIAERVGPPLAAYAEAWLRHLWEHSNRPFGREGIAVHDLYAVAGAAGIPPGHWEHFRIRVDTSEEVRRGTIDARPAAASDPRAVAVARDLDPTEMKEFLIDSLRRLTRRLQRPEGTTGMR